jgi:nicotinamidase-related amidase
MPITTLDPHTALVVIDLQRFVAGLPTVHPMADVLANAAKLCAAFRKRELPVVLVNVAGGAPGRTEMKRNFSFPPGWTDLMPELDQQPSDILVTKYTVGAFHGTPLDMMLRRKGVTQIVLCGVSTSSGVEATGRAAYEHGYNVTFAVDAMSDLAREMHDHSVQRTFPKLGETGTTADVLAKLP